MENFTAGSARDSVYLGSDRTGSCNSFAAEREPEAPAGHQVGPGFHNSYLASALLIRMFIPDPGYRSVHFWSGFFQPGSRDQKCALTKKNWSISWTQKLLLSTRKYDPGGFSRIPDSFHHGSRSRIQGSKKHWIPDQQHCWGLKLDCKTACSDRRLCTLHCTCLLFTPPVWGY